MRIGAAGDQDRAPDQRPGVEGVDVFGAGLAGEEDRVELVVDVAAGAEPGEAVVGERRPGADEDGDDHRQQQPDDGTDQRAEHSLDALVRPLRAVLGGVLLVQLASYFFLLNAGTPPALLITSPASGLSRIQSMNLVSAGGLVLPSPGRTMNR